MNLYESLLSEFGYNKPILFSEIKFNNWCPQQISRDLRKLCQDGKVVKFDSGIYYIPKTTPFGVAHFNPKKVIDKKFIKEAAEHGLINLAGNAGVGGMCASLYNSMPYEGVELLIKFMKEFVKNNPKITK